METKILHIKVILFLLLQCMFVFAVNSEAPICQAGYGILPTNLRTSGSQCSGPFKITTEAECKLAAEYNSKNNIDKNEGYRGRWSSPYVPPGCYYDSGWKVYRFNDYTKSTKQCSNDKKCICKACIKCPINTYNSEGGINPTCTPCPSDRPTTNFNTIGQTSIDACIPVPTIKCEAGYEFVNDGITKKKECKKCKNAYSASGGNDIKCTPCPSDRPYTFLDRPTNSINSCTSVKDAITCKAGEGAPSGRIFSSGDASQCSGISKITTEAECKLAAEYNSKNNIDQKEGYGGRMTYNAPQMPNQYI